MPTKIKIIIAATSLALLGAACTPGQGGSRSGDGGVWLTTNKGENWQQKILIYNDRTSTKTIADVFVKKLLFAAPNDTRKLFAVSPTTGLWVSWNAGGNWDLILPASELADIAINPDNPRVIYAGIGRAIAKTENEGDNWRAIYNTDQEQHFITALALLPSKPAIIYGGTNRGDILFSEDTGRSWRTITRLSGPIQRLAVHPYDSSIMYVGLPNGLAQSLDSGQNWKMLSAEMAAAGGAGHFRDFTFTPTGLIYAHANGLLRSLDQGAHWVNLPLISRDQDSSIYALAVNRQNPLEIYYGTRSTFYHSLDGGFNWIPRSLPTTKTPLTILVNPEEPSMIYMGVGKVK